MLKKSDVAGGLKVDTLEAAKTDSRAKSEAKTDPAEKAKAADKAKAVTKVAPEAEVEAKTKTKAEKKDPKEKKEKKASGKTAKKAAAKTAPKKEKLVLILAGRHGLALEVEQAEQGDGALVHMAAVSGGENQQWRMIPEGEYVKFVCLASGKALDLIASGTENGTWLHQWEPLETDSQLWYVEKEKGGFCRIRSKHCDRYLDIVGISDEEGANVQVWEQAEGDNQRWKLKEVKAKK